MAETFFSGITYQAGGLAVWLGAALVLVLAGVVAMSRRRARDVTPAPELTVSPRQAREDITAEDLAARGPDPP